MLSSLDNGILEEIFDAMEKNVHKRQCIDVILSLLDKNQKKMTQHLVGRILNSEGR